MKYNVTQTTGWVEEKGSSQKLYAGGFSGNSASYPAWINVLFDTYTIENATYSGCGYFSVSSFVQQWEATSSNTSVPYKYAAIKNGTLVCYYSGSDGMYCCYAPSNIMCICGVHVEWPTGSMDPRTTSYLYGTSYTLSSSVTYTQGSSTGKYVYDDSSSAYVSGTYSYDSSSGSYYWYVLQ